MRRHRPGGGFGREGGERRGARLDPGLIRRSKALLGQGLFSLVGLGGVVVAACAGSPTPATSHQPQAKTQGQSPASELEDPAAQAPDQKEAASILELSQGPVVEIQPGALLRNTLPAQIDEADLSRVAIALEEPPASADSAVPILPWNASVVAVLDEQMPRPLLEASTPLESLVDELLELAPGQHELVLLSRSRSELLVQTQRFAFGVEPRSDAAPTTCLLYLPAGTYNGSRAASQIEFLAVPLSKRVQRVDYKVTADGFEARGTGEPGRVLIGRAFPDGDVRVTATCHDEQGRVLGSAKRIITVNGELGPEPNQAEREALARRPREAHE